jgi:hypothetical protein
MLALVCILECLDLTGLELHEWLGFTLCPLVLLHVSWQWPWFVMQFRKFLGAPSARVRINALLNVLLLVLMSAVLISGVLNSRQAISLVGERFGRTRVWREMHNWLNFTLLVWVALHLGLNWDWVLGVLTRRHRDKPPLVESASPINASSRARHPLFRRGLAVLSAAILSTGATYLVMQALVTPPQDRPEPQTFSRGQLVPEPRPIQLPHGFEQLSVTSGLVLGLALLGRYVFRLRL